MSTALSIIEQAIKNILVIDDFQWTSTFNNPNATEEIKAIAVLLAINESFARNLMLIQDTLLSQIRG